MLVKSSLPHLIIPDPVLAEGKLFHHQGIGTDQPLSKEIIKPLFDLGLHHGFISQRSSYKTQWKEPRNFHILCIVLSGAINFYSKQGDHSLETGELIFCPSNQLKGFKIESKTHFILFEFEEDSVWEKFSKLSPQIRPYESTDLFYLLVKRIAEAYDERSLLALDRAKDDAKHLADLCRREITFVKRKPPKEITRLRDLVSRICEKPEYDWALEDLAKSLKVSINTLSRIFIRSYGLTPMEMVIRERMMKAARLLTVGDEKVLSIANSVGYDSLSSFSRLFKKHMGRRPGEYRRNFAQSS